MVEAKASIRRQSTMDKVDTKLNTNLTVESTHDIPPTPMEPAGANGASKLPVYEGTRLPQSVDAVHVDAPPSYEDAIASNIPPINAHRPDYEPPPAAAEDDVLGGDEKKRFFGRRDS